MRTGDSKIRWLLTPRIPELQFYSSILFPLARHASFLKSCKRQVAYSVVSRKLLEKRKRCSEDSQPNSAPSRFELQQNRIVGERGWMSNPLARATKTDGVFIMDPSMNEKFKEAENTMLKYLTQPKRRPNKSGQHENSAAKANPQPIDREASIMQTRMEEMPSMQGRASAHEYPRRRSSFKPSSASQVADQHTHFEMAQQYISLRDEGIALSPQPQDIVKSHIRSLVDSLDTLNLIKQPHDRLQGVAYEDDSALSRPDHNNMLQERSKSDEAGEMEAVHTNFNRSDTMHSSSLTSSTNTINSWNNLQNTSDGKEPTESILHDNLKSGKPHLDDSSDAPIDQNTGALNCNNVMNQTLSGTHIVKHSLATLWQSLGATFVAYNDCAIPSVFPKGSVHAHRHTRTQASLFDISYSTKYTLVGEDNLSVGDHFLTCSLANMEVGDVQYATILDSKGLILDDCFVYKTAQEVELLLSSNQKTHVLAYIKSYILHCKQSRLRVGLRISEAVSTISLQGPKALDVLLKCLESYAAPVAKVSDDAAFVPEDEVEQQCPEELNFYLSTRSFNGEPIGIDKIAALPYMSAFYMSLFNWCSKSHTFVEQSKIECLRVGFTGEDGFNFVAASDKAASCIARILLKDHRVSPGGLFAYDMLRMEAGLPRSGVDLAARMSPVSASLVWSLYQKDLKTHTIFGWKRIVEELMHGPPVRRIGLICSQMVFSGCRILSNPRRQPIGEVTSSAWSPTFKHRIAQGYVKTEFARNNEFVLIAVPQPAPRELSKKRRDKLLRMKGLRKIITAKIVRLPFVSHSYYMLPAARKLAEGKPFTPSQKTQRTRTVYYDISDSA